MHRPRPERRGVRPITQGKVDEAKRLMDTEGISQREAARRVGIGQASLNQILKHGTQNKPR